MALFIDTDDFKRHAPEIHKNYDWAQLSVKVNQITLQRVIPYISQAEYDVLETAYLANTTNTKQKGLLAFIQPAIAYYTYMSLLTTNRVQISTMGVQDSNSQDGTSSPASFHAINDVKEEIATSAYYFMDQALLYMELNKVDFPAWAASTEYTELNSIFVSNTAILNKYVHAGMSRHTYLSLKSELLAVQIQQIRQDLGDTFYNALLTQFKAGTLSAENALVVALIQAWQAPASMLRALPHQRVKLINGGIFLRSNLDGPDRTYNPSNNAMRQIEAQLTEQVQSARNELINFLDTNADDYPAYTVSEYILNDGNPSHSIPDNACKKSFRV